MKIISDITEMTHYAEKLADEGDRIGFVTGDLRDPGWTDAVEGPFDAVVSSIAIHNVREPAICRVVDFSRTAQLTAEADEVTPALIERHTLEGKIPSIVNLL